jgi:hypothetical protein
LYSLTNYGGIVNRLQARAATAETSDRYSFYRLVSQLGVDSAPANRGKLQLNYDNSVGELTNTIQRWTNAVRFFTNAAELMLRASIDRTLSRVEILSNGARVTNVYYQIGDSLVRTNFSINNIQIYRPGYDQDIVYRDGNEHNSTIHRILQLAANIYDSTTNKVSYPYFPTVLRPIYTRTQTNIYISGWEEVPEQQALRIVTLPFQNPRSFFTNSSSVNESLTNLAFFGQHFIVGAKKGHPNLNELAMQNYVEVSRKLEVARAGAGMVTNQMFLVSLFNRWGMEAWNSYTSSYPKNVQLAGQIRSRIAVHNLAITNGNTLVYFTNVVSSGGGLTNNWAGLAFQVPVNAVHPLINDVAYFTATGFTLTNQVRFGQIEPAPKFQVYSTNDVQFYIFDRNQNRLIDYVSFSDLVTVTDISTNLYSPQQQRIVAGRAAFNEDMFWDPRLVPGSPFLTVGVTNQIAVSQGEIEVDEATWRAYRFNSPDKRGGISKFRMFMGLGLRSTDDPNTPPSTNLAMQTPFVPTRRIHQLITWQANDPLVHYMPDDLTRPTNSAKPVNLPIAEPLPEWNIGRLNNMYHPWGGHPQVEPRNDPFAYNMALQDPGVRKSDDWEFPADDVRTNNYSYIFPNIGALGRVHRGTPWQTVYLKSVYQFGASNDVVVMARPSLWQSWAGTLGGYPMNDWRLLDVFTTAVHENAARGLLSVNQTNQAAWSAVLSGVTVATNMVRDSDLTGLAFNEGLEPTNTYRAITIEPATAQITRIVESINRARMFQPEMILNPNRAQRTTDPWVIGPKTNVLNGRQMTVFHSAGEILSAPALTLQSPFLNGSALQVRHVWTDRAVEYIPQQILSLVQRDEPRFVVYAFGQALKPAPRSLSTHPDFYNICTNYQITGEVITKTTFRVEGELRNPGNPLRTIVENYQILPPPE